MYLSIRTVKGYKYLCMYESYRDPKTGKARTRFIKSYGRYDLLDDKVRKAYEDEQARKLMTKKLEAEARKEILSEAVSVINNNNNNNTLDGELMVGDTQTILNAVGLGEVPLHVSLKQLKNILKISKCNDSQILSYEHLKMAKLSNS